MSYFVFQSLAYFYGKKPGKFKKKSGELKKWIHKKRARIQNWEPLKQWRQSEFTDLVASKRFEQIVKKGFNKAVPMTIFSTYTTKK